MAHGGTSGWWRCCRWTSTPGTGWTTEDAVPTSKAGAWTVYGRLHNIMSIVYINVVFMKQNSTAGIMGFCTYYKNRYSFLVIVQWRILVPHLSRESCFLVMSRLYGLFTVNFYKLVCWHFFFVVVLLCVHLSIFISFSQAHQFSTTETCFHLISLSLELAIKYEGSLKNNNLTK